MGKAGPFWRVSRRLGIGPGCRTSIETTDGWLGFQSGIRLRTRKSTNQQEIWTDEWQLGSSGICAFGQWLKCRTGGFRIRWSISRQLGSTCGRGSLWKFPEFCKSECGQSRKQLGQKSAKKKKGEAAILTQGNKIYKTGKHRIDRSTCEKWLFVQKKEKNCRL